MMKQRRLFGIEDQLRRLSDLGDQLELLGSVVDFEAFRSDLVIALRRSDRGRGGRPPYDPVMMFKILVIQSLNDLSDERTEYLINDRLSFMRFLGLELGDRVPDARTIWLYRDLLTREKAIDRLFSRLDTMIVDQGFLAMGGQIVDATIVSAPKQRMNEVEKADVKAGKSAADIWPDRPAKARQKDTSARWSIKYSKAKPKVEGGEVPKGHVDIAIPSFGYKNHIVTDRHHGFIRAFDVTSAAAHDGAVLRRIVGTGNTSGKVWADSAYRSNKNEAWLEARGLTSCIHRRKPKGKAMPAHIRRGNNSRSKVRAFVEHVFADQKNRIGLFVRSIGIDRARTRIGLVNMAYNMRRLIYWQRLVTG